MRGVRAAKFAEYVSTYAILNNIGIHEAVLVERRDASVGLGVYAHAACDAGTTLLVVPAQRACTVSTLSRIGTRVAFRTPETSAQLDYGLISFLTGAPNAATWMELCWRLALENHRSYSHWWGWLQSVPSAGEYAAVVDGSTAQCRALRTELYPHLLRGHKTLLAEKEQAYKRIVAINLSPTFAQFSWAVDTVLTRGTVLPCCWTAEVDSGATEARTSGAGSSADTELGIVPFADLINGPDENGRSANAVVEIASGEDELPEWYLQWVLHEAKLKGRDGATDLARVLGQRFCLCVSLSTAVQASEEIILPYDCASLSTGVLSAHEDAELTRRLKFLY